MFNFFNEKKVNKIGYEDVLYVIKNHENYLFINTLSNEKQDCLIKNSLTIENEVTQINFLLEQQKFNIKIVIYGEHSCDPSIDKKYKQLKMNKTVIGKLRFYWFNFFAILRDLNK